MYRIRQFITLLKAIFGFYDQEKISGTLNEIAWLIFDQNKLLARYSRTFVMMVGFSKSGKHTLIDSDPTLRRFLRIDTDLIHQYLNQRFQSLQDDFTITGPAYLLRQYYTKIVRDRISKFALCAGIGIISDSCNLRRSDRKKRLKEAKRHGYQTMIVWVMCDEQELLRRLDEADDKKVSNGQKPAWRDLYFRVQKPRFERPLTKEADRFIVENGESFLRSQIKIEE